MRSSFPPIVFAVSLGAVVAASCASEGSGNDTSNGDTGDGDTASATGGTCDVPPLGCAAGLQDVTSDGSTDPIMQTWGAPCCTDADCVALIGEGAICETRAVLFELPGGYCTKPCEVPQGMTVVLDAADCGPGVACVGQDPIYERCILPCTDDQQCDREGYQCRTMPMIAQEGDPTFCLMPDCCYDTCAEG